MNITNTLTNFLYDKDYFITLYNNKLYLHNYIEVIHLADNLLKVKFVSFFLHVYGENFKVLKMTKNEILLDGMISKLEKIYHE